MEMSLFAKSVGRILCRFPPDTREVSKLGIFIKDSISMERDPFFLIKEEGCRITDAQVVKISQNLIDHMIRKRQFWLGRVTIQLSNKLAATEIELCFRDSEVYPISGFPRPLFQDDTPHTSKSNDVSFSVLC